MGRHACGGVAAAAYTPKPCVSECIGPRLALPTTRLSAAGRLPPRSNRGGPTRTCAYVLDEVALRPDHDGSAHNADNVSRSPTSGMRTASESWGCWARRTDPAMAMAGCQMSSTSRAAGSAEGSEPHWHPGSCCICSIGTPPGPRSRPTSVRGRADADRFFCFFCFIYRHTTARRTQQVSPRREPRFR